ncbi:MAG: hypothetical protein K0R12_526 [Gammaproteobacteria bacterium]|jgi:hypothetical protein|nr:hypothetical protein [Gammaproteobacteria bacterium]
MLSWAAWLRMHHQDPQWAQHVLIEDCWEGLDFSLWANRENWDSKIKIRIIDTTCLSLSETAAQVAKFIDEQEDLKQNILKLP